MAKRTKKRKVGLIPYCFEDGQLFMYFMVPSDPDFGGSDPQIAKGGIDAGENEYEAALREASEELGLVDENIISMFLVYVGNPFHVYAVHISDPENFKIPHFETGATMWLTEEQFEEQGRDFMRPMVRYIAQQIIEKHDKDLAV